MLSPMFWCMNLCELILTGNRVYVFSLELFSYMSIRPEKMKLVVNKEALNNYHITEG